MVRSTDPDFVGELQALRNTYVGATPKQRLNIIRQRVHNPQAGPNQLVTHVSAVEALARTLAMHLHAKTKADLAVLYPRYRYRNAKTLVAEYVRAQGAGEPASVFGADTWQLFVYAVEYRNLLAHECTYLARYKYDPLIQASTEVLEKLRQIAGLSEYEPNP